MRGSMSFQIGTFFTSAKLRSGTHPFGVASHVLRRHVAVEVFVAHAIGQRQAPERPLVLNVEPEVLVLRLESVRGGPLREADGHLVVECVLDVIRAVFRLDLEVAFLELKTALDVVTARDVRRLRNAG